jgi:uncharacterized repeat protein (TIGR01451 family)
VRFPQPSAFSRFTALFPLRWSLFVALGFATLSPAHNLDQVNTHLRFDLQTINQFEFRSLINEPLIQAGDELGIVFKSTPGPGTNIGAGGYFTFYIPEGTQVTGAEYGDITSSGNFVPLPLKPPANMPLGTGPVGSASSSALASFRLGPNIIGQSALTADASGRHNGTLAGIYGDVGIFYSTDPDTAWRTFETSGGFDGNPATNDNTLTTNSGDPIIPSNLWDAAQLMAFGMKNPAAPFIDPDGRGNAPWGLASPVAGPQSGYAWSFDLAEWRSKANDPRRMQKSIKKGPWKRIRYEGSTVANDQPGLNSNTTGIATQNADTLGVELSPDTPLPPTLDWSDNSSPKAIRIAFGELQLGHSEHGRVRLKVLPDNPADPGAPLDPNRIINLHSDVSGGDAGGTSNGKDHTWRYVTSSPLSTQTASHFQKTFAKTIVSVGESSYFDLVVVNSSADEMRNVVVRDPLPSGISYLEANETPTSTSPLTWNLGTIPAQGFRRIRVEYLATTRGTRFNTAQMTWHGGTKSATDSVDVTTSGIITPPSDMSVGNLLFLDGNGNGKADTGEGLPNIELALYEGDDQPGINPPRETVVTGPNGQYLFTGLEPNEYKIHIPARYFQPGQPLTGTFSVTGVRFGDDDQGEDGEDSLQPWVTGITSREFLLSEGTAPSEYTYESGFQSASDNANDSNVDLTIDLGLYIAVGLGNHVFIDANRNSKADPGEGFDGVTLELYPDGTAPGTHAPFATTTTSNGGIYSFVGLPPGAYRVHINKEMFTANTPLHGMISIPTSIAGDDDVGSDGNALGDLSQTGVTSNLVSIGIGTAPTSDTGETGLGAASDDLIDSAIDLTVDFGFQRRLQVGNLVFSDTNLNGRYDTGEGLAGVQVSLFKASQDPLSELPEASTTTDSEGRYLFDFLYADSYFVFIPPEEFAPGNRLANSLSIPGNARNQDDNLSEDGIDSALPFATGIRSTTFTLAMNTAPTGAQYETGAFSDSDDADDTNGNLTIDFGFQIQDPLQVGVGNLVFIDQNANGMADDNEGVPGVQLQIFPSTANPLSDPPLATTITDDLGTYFFSQLEEGSYLILIPPSEFQPGKPLASLISLPGAGLDFGNDDDLDENGIDATSPTLTGIRSYAFFLSPDSEPTGISGEQGVYADLDNADDDNADLTIDFGFTHPVALGNLVFFDLNDNGRADPAEGVPNVPLRLFPPGADPISASPLATTTTDSRGRYLFSNLAPGQYFVHIPPAAFGSGAPLNNRISLPGHSSGDDDSGEDGLDNASHELWGLNSQTLSLSPGLAPAGPAESGFDATSDDADDTSTDLTLDLGFTLPATLGTLVFSDLNADGLHQPNGNDALSNTPDDEIPLSGVLIEFWSTGDDGLIDTPDDQLINSIETGTNGTAQLSGLASGTFFLRIPTSAFETGSPLADLPVVSLITNPADDQTPGDNNGSQPNGKATTTNSPIITLSPGETDTTIGFGFINSAFPLTWSAWQSRNTALPDTTPTGDPDGDSLPNLLEFAFGLDSQTGIASRPPLRIEVDPTTQRIDLCLDRVASLSGLTLTLELLPNLANSPAGWSDNTTLTPIVTPRPDDTEELRFQNIAAHPAFNASPSQGFARLRLALDADLNGTPEATLRTHTLGWTRLTLGTHLQTLAHSFTSPARFTATLESITGTSLNLPSALNGASPSTLFTPGAQHYLEVLSGTHAGHRLELNETASTTAFVLDPTSTRHTLPGNPPATLIGARLALRQHLTLADLADRTRFTATNNPATADRVLIYNTAASTFQTYWLFAFGGTPRWVRQGDGTFANQAALVIEPGRGLFIHSRTQSVSLVLTGQVRDHPFASPLLQGVNLYASGWPMPLSPNALQMTFANGFTANLSSSLADQIQRWQADTQPTAQGYQGLFYLGSGTFRQWTTIGDNTFTNQSNTPILQPHRALFIRTRTPRPSWTPPSPWTP